MKPWRAGPACFRPWRRGLGRHGVDCLIVDPLDADGWVEAIRRLSGDEGLRRSLGEQARLRSLEFTWEKVAQRRRIQLLEACRARSI